MGDKAPAQQLLYASLCKKGLPECLSACIAAEVESFHLADPKLLGRLVHSETLPSSVLRQAFPWRIWEVVHDVMMYDHDKSHLNVEDCSRTWRGYTCLWRDVHNELLDIGL